MLNIDKGRNNKPGDKDQIGHQELRQSERPIEDNKYTRTQRFNQKIMKRKQRPRINNKTTICLCPWKWKDLGNRSIFRIAVKIKSFYTWAEKLLKTDSSHCALVF